MENYEIIGEVGDTVYDVTKPVEAAMYFPILSGIPNRTSEATIVAWTSGDPLAMSMPIQQQISALEPELPVYNALTMDQILGKSTATQGFAANLILAFAALSLLLAAVGLYGVLSYLVTQRVSEIGIRIALGAQREQILRLILFDGLRPALLGLVLGLIASAGVMQLIRSMLYGTAPYDPARHCRRDSHPAPHRFHCLHLSRLARFASRSNAGIANGMTQMPGRSAGS